MFYCHQVFLEIPTSILLWQSWFYLIPSPSNINININLSLRSVNHAYCFLISIYTLDRVRLGLCYCGYWIKRVEKKQCSSSVGFLPGGRCHIWQYLCSSLKCTHYFFFFLTTSNDHVRNSKTSTLNSLEKHKDWLRFLQRMFPC